MRVTEDRKDNTCCDLVCDLVVVELQLCEVQNIRQNHRKGFHALFVHLEVLDTNLLIVWIIIVVEL